MTLNPIKANMTELNLGDGTLVLFSYKTPVAARYTSEKGQTHIARTAYKWSNTTTRHINTWLAGLNNWEGVPVETEPQEFFDGLVKGGK